MRVAGALVVVLLTLVASVDARGANDPVTTDPRRDAKAPGGSEELRIPSGDSKMNALLYRAQGQGVHPVVVLLHGFPGNERNLDLAQALRRAGFHVLFFNYCGTWGSGGTFGWQNTRDDVKAALAFLRTPENADKWGIDPKRIHVVGHSLGGWLALAGAVDDNQVRCSVAIAPWDLGTYGAMLTSKEKPVEDALGWFSSTMDADAGPVRGVSAQALVDEAMAHAEAWSFASLAKGLEDTRGLVVSTKDEAKERDTDPAPLLAGLKGRAWVLRVVDDDHGLSHHRIVLARDVVGWLKTACAR
jgi:pimeloyl-ACP methyl ester carboxylesterase